MKHFGRWFGLALGILVGNAVVVPLASDRSYMEGLGIGMLAAALVLIVAWAKRPRDQGRHRQPSAAGHS